METVLITLAILACLAAIIFLIALLLETPKSFDIYQEVTLLESIKSVPKGSIGIIMDSYFGNAYDVQFGSETILLTKDDMI